MPPNKCQTVTNCNDRKVNMMVSVNEVRSDTSLKNENSSENIIIRKITIAAALLLTIAIAAAISVAFICASVNTYIVSDGAKSVSFASYDVLKDSQVLEQSGFSLDNNDTMSLSLSGIKQYTLNITRNSEVTVCADGKEQVFVLGPSIVADALDKAGVIVGEDDVVNLSLTAYVCEGLKINVDRVSYNTITKTEELTHKEYSELAKSDENLDDAAVKAGQTGVVTYVYKNKLVNGKLEKSELIDQKLEKVTTAQSTTKATTKTTRPTSSQIKAKSGSSSVVYEASGKAVSCISTLKPTNTIKLDANGAPTSYSKKITGEATAYYQGSKTSTGVKPKPGYVAVDPREIPYGTKLYIRSSDGKYNYGYAIAADTGGFIYNSDTVVDLYFYSSSDCYNFGRRNVEIYVLD